MTDRIAWDARHDWTAPRPPEVDVDFNTGCRTLCWTDNQPNTGDRFIAIDYNDEPPLRVRARVLAVTPLGGSEYPNGNPDFAVIDFHTYGRRAIDLPDLTFGDDVTFTGNWVWPDRIPEWDDDEGPPTQRDYQVSLGQATVDALRDAGAPIGFLEQLQAKVDEEGS